MATTVAPPAARKPIIPDVDLHAPKWWERIPT
jgi:hypothetical protein